MFEKDYILRLLDKFFTDLNQFISRTTPEKKQSELVALFKAYAGDYDFFHTSSVDAIIQSFDKYGSDEKTYRIQIAAELYYQEALLEQGTQEKKSLWQKAFRLMDYLDKYSNTYSIDRKLKMDFIRKNLSE